MPIGPVGGTPPHNPEDLSSSNGSSKLERVMQDIGEERTRFNHDPHNKVVANHLINHINELRNDINTDGIPISEPKSNLLNKAYGQLGHAIDAVNDHDPKKLDESLDKALHYYNESKHTA